MDTAGAASLAVGLSVLAVLVQVTTQQVADGQVSKNSVVGIRTRATMASDGAWLAGHRAALPGVTRASYLGPPLAAVGVLVTIFGGRSVPGTVLVVGAFALYLVLVVVAVRAAGRAARAAA